MNSLRKRFSSFKLFHPNIQLFNAIKTIPFPSAISSSSYSCLTQNVISNFKLSTTIIASTMKLTLILQRIYQIFSKFKQHTCTNHLYHLSVDCENDRHTALQPVALYQIHIAVCLSFFPPTIIHIIYELCYCSVKRFSGTLIIFKLVAYFF